MSFLLTFQNTECYITALSINDRALTTAIEEYKAMQLHKGKIINVDWCIVDDRLTSHDITTHDIHLNLIFVYYCI